MINAERYVNGVGLVLCLLLCLGLASKPPSLQSCSRYWLKMTDNNFNKALERYEACVNKVPSLKGKERRFYEESLMHNLDKTATFFFEKSSLPTVEVVQVMRSVAKLMDVLAEKGRYVVKDKLGLGETDKKLRAIFYGFIVLIICQITIMLCLVWKFCSIKNLTYRNELYMKCREKSFDVIQNQRANFLLKDEENFPLIEKKKQWSFNCESAHNAKMKQKDDDILTDFSSLSSPGVGSDSELEALMNRRPLPKPKCSKENKVHKCSSKSSGHLKDQK